MLLRVADTDDAEAIAAIYNRVVETSTATFDLVPRSLDEQRDWIARRSGAHVVIVAELDGQVVGYGSLSPYRDRPAYSTSVEDSIYIDHRHLGRGLGRALLDELVDRARDHGFHAIFARIVGGHDASLALHRAAGFEEVGLEREVGRKFGQWLDVVLMEQLLATDGPPTRNRPL